MTEENDKGLKARWTALTQGSQGVLTKRLQEETGIDFGALKVGDLGKELGNTLSALGLLALGIKVSILVGVLMLLAYVFLLVPNAHHLQSAWAAGAVDVLGFVWFVLGAVFLTVTVTLYLFARRAAGGVSGLFTVTFETLRTVSRALSPDNPKKPTFGQILGGVLAVVTFPLLFDFAGSKVPFVGPMIGRRLEGAFSKAIVERIVDKEDLPTLVVNGEVIDDENAADTIADIMQKTERYAAKAESVNQWVRGKVTRPFLGMAAFCGLLTFGPLIGLALLEVM